jgi:methylmalonyl-CoA mutase cobalamin-binding domain/chain
MIGFPSSTANTVNALKAGVTTIGNLSQYFAHEVPAWRDHVTTAVETVRALSIMSAKRKNGAVVHSYLEDGFGALFHDCATIAGWALLECYIVEHLLEAKLTHCIGGLTSDPIKRAGWIFALNDIHRGDCLGSMVYGDTISFTRDYAVNRAIVGEYLIWDIMTQLECPTGHAVLPLPVTESYRIPSAEEIVEAQIYGHRIEEAARRLWPNVDFTGARNFSNEIVSAGKNVFNRALDGLKESGADTDDPLQLLYLLKMMGPSVFEEMFGNRDHDGRDMLLEPQIPSDMYLLSQRGFEENRSFFGQPEVRNRLQGKRMLIASTDVHEHAVRIIARLLTEAGVDIVNMGSEKDPHEVAGKAAEIPVDAVLISTHNGMALAYAARLKKALNLRNIQVPVIMGGVLNQKFEDRALPVDVAQDLKALGYKTCSKLGPEMTRLLEQSKA